MSETNGQSSETIEARTGALEAALEHVIEAAVLFYNKTSKRPTTLPKINDFLLKTPFYPAFKECLCAIMYLEKEALEIKVRETGVPEDYQEQIFPILFVALLFDLSETYENYLSKVDWGDWHPLNTDDKEYKEMYKKLIEHSPQLARFSKPSP